MTRIYNEGKMNDNEEGKADGMQLAVKYMYKANSISLSHVTSEYMHTSI